MYNFLSQELTVYYGLDWVTACLMLLGLWLVAEKKRTGFLVAAAGSCVGVVVSLMADQYGFLLSNAAMVFVSLRGYLLWKNNYEYTSLQLQNEKSPEGLFFCAVEGTRTLDLPRDRRTL